jgi:DinB family protein
MNMNDSLREQLMNLLDWQSAHVGFDVAVEGIPPELRGVQPDGLPYSPWQLLEHMRLCQLDILEFCRNPEYKEPAMEEYWPKTVEPPTPKAWDESIRSFLNDREDLKKLAVDPKIDLFATIPHGAGQTYLREFLLVADHNAYHLGQLVAVQRLLGCW